MPSGSVMMATMMLIEDGKLKLDFAHPYLAERGFDPKLCEEFYVGYSKAGKMAGRIAFQIRNPAGDIIAINGVEQVGIGATVCDTLTLDALPLLKVDEPTQGFLFAVEASSLQ